MARKEDIAFEINLLNRNSLHCKMSADRFQQNINRRVGSRDWQTRMRDHQLALIERNNAKVAELKAQLAEMLAV